jgi:hypothetical protein
VSDQPNYLHLVGRLVQDKHDFHNQARITGFRKKGKKKLFLQLQLKDRRKWYLADTVLTHWDLV